MNLAAVGVQNLKFTTTIKRKVNTNIKGEVDTVNYRGFPNQFSGTLRENGYDSGA